MVSPNGPVIIGQVTCINSSADSNDMIKISCEVNNDMNTIPYRISWFRNGMDLGFSGNLYTATENGTYTCRVQNDCGISEKSTTIISK